MYGREFFQMLPPRLGLQGHTPVSSFSAWTVFQKHLKDTLKSTKGRHRALGNNIPVGWEKKKG